MCVCVYIYIYTCVYIYMCIYIYTHVCIFLYMCVYIYTCIYIYTHMCMYFIYICIQLMPMWECYVKSLQSCPTLNNPPGSSVHGILQARILKWVAVSSSTEVPVGDAGYWTWGLAHAKHELYHWATPSKGTLWLHRLRMVSLNPSSFILWHFN